MAEIRHLENRHDVIFFCRAAEGGPILDKISMTAVMWSKSKPDGDSNMAEWRTFGRIQWHVIPEPRITLHGAATW